MLGTEILAKLEKNGFEAYFVGGCVRDSFLQIKTHDSDICTSATPQQIKACFKKTVDTGLRHGTVTVLTDEGMFEVTTFRREGTYSDGRRPDYVTFSSTLIDDLSRRDFTMNAIAMDKNGNIYDPFDGLSDIRKGIIRAVGNPDNRFYEDALRIVRALRFSATLGFQIEEKTATALLNQKQRLEHISVERIFSELKRLLIGKNVGEVLTSYRDVFGQIIPELMPTFHSPCRSHQYPSIYIQTVKAVENIPPNEVLRLCMLLHDIAAPLCSDKIYDHAEKGALLARTILRRLKCDNAMLSRVSRLIQEHHRPIAETKVEIKKYLSAFGTEFFEQLLQVKAADTHLRQESTHLQKLKTLYLQILQKKECFSLPQLSVNGSDIAALGVQGSEIGKVLQLLLDAVISDSVPNEKSALIHLAKAIKRTD